MTRADLRSNAGPEASTSLLLQVQLQEYSKLKDEQANRIGFRDNLTYVMFLVFGGVLYFALTNRESLFALLAVPWASFVLGWIYLMNFEKIRDANIYFRENLRTAVASVVNAPPEKIFEWEGLLRTDGRSRSRKLLQLLADEVTFVGSGGAAVTVYFWMSESTPPAFMLFAAADVLLLALLFAQFIPSADLHKPTERRWWPYFSKRRTRRASLNARG